MNEQGDLHKHLYPGSEKLRILHIGNIANNGYNIANLFNQAGIKSDLIIGPYYHVAGCPEWEDSEFTGDIGDQFYPRWDRVKITNGFTRPKWVAQGPWELCIRYLMHKNAGNSVRARILWYSLRAAQRFAGSDSLGTATNIIGNPRKFSFRLFGHARFLAWRILNYLRWKIVLVAWRAKNIPYFLKYWTLRYAAKMVMVLNRVGLVPAPAFRFLKAVNRKRVARYNRRQLANQSSNQQHGDEETVEGEPQTIQVSEQKQRSKHFASIDPQDLAQYESLADMMEPLFDHYDLIVGYSTDGLWPLITGKPYIAYEHGTLRTLPFENTLQGKLCKIVYQNANAVIVSNFDNNLAAERLGLKNYHCIPHYINEMNIDPAEGDSIRSAWLEQFQADFIVYNPSRQHWTENRDGGWEKGNDVLIRGLARFIHEVNPQAMAVFTNWGQSVAETKRLLQKLGIEDRVLWVDPVPHKRMIQYILASDVVSDQFLLRTFGGIPAKGFMHGRPVLSAFDAEIHQWCFKNMPPFLASNNESQIFQSLSDCYSDRATYKAVAKKSQDWYYEEHSNSNLLRRMSRICHDVVVDRSHKNNDK